MQFSVEANNLKSAASACPMQNKPTLQVGSQGMEVLELQKLLSHWGITIRSRNSVFDKELAQAVKKFQRKVFLEADSVVGPLTWKALYTGAPINMPLLRQGSYGRAVTLLQQALQATGDYQAVVDGKFGDRTEAAVKRFQKRSGLVIDGIVGMCTWHSLSKTHCE
jgi:peptidoglycan hydrolase-like protein with peptidoglycan-binding domain